MPSEFRCSLVIAQAVIIVVAGVLPVMPKRVARKVAPISFTRWLRVITKCSLLSPELMAGNALERARQLHVDWANPISTDKFHLREKLRLLMAVGCRQPNIGVVLTYVLGAEQQLR